MKYKLVILALWLIAGAATAFVLRGTGLFTFLGPVFFICMLGSVLVVQWATRGGNRSD